MTRYATDWLAVGACLTAGPGLFFPIATGAIGAVGASGRRRGRGASPTSRGERAGAP